MDNDRVLERARLYALHGWPHRAASEFSANDDDLLSKRAGALRLRNMVSYDWRALRLMDTKLQRIGLEHWGSKEWATSAAIQWTFVL